MDIGYLRNKSGAMLLEPAWMLVASQIWGDMIEPACGY